MVEDAMHPMVDATNTSATPSFAAVERAASEARWSRPVQVLGCENPDRLIVGHPLNRWIGALRVKLC